MNSSDLIASLSEPGRPNPNEDAAERAMWQWLDGLGLCREEHSRTNVQRTQIAHCVGLYFPTASLERLGLISRIAAWSLLIDDEFDVGSAGRDPALCKASIASILQGFEDDADMTGRSAMERATAELWTELASQHSAEWKARYRFYMTRYLWSYYTNAIDHVAGRIPQLSEYRERRIDTYAGLWFLHLGEHSIGVDLPDAVHFVPAFRSLFSTVAYISALDNDRFSVERERATGVQDNAIFVLQHHEGLSPEQALARVEQIVAGGDELIAASYHELPQQLDHSGLSPETIAYALRCADMYIDFTRGARWYYSTSPRYDASALPPGTALAEGFATTGGTLSDH